MKKYLMTLFQLLLFAQVFAGVKIKTVPTDKADYYEWISFLSQGPQKWEEMTEEGIENADSDFIAGRSYRIVVLTAEIYSTVFIEEITEGIEGCCKRLNSIRKLDLDDFAEKFKLKGEISGFKFVEWVSYTSIKFSMHSRNFEISNLDQTFVTIEEKS